jgi:cyclophilin family peptidyl-prolyl cis-trans isomerase
MGTAKRERQKQGRQPRLAEAQSAAARRKRTRTGLLLAGLVVVLVGVTLAMGGLGGDDEEPVDVGAASSTTATTAPEEPYGTTTECPAADGSSVQTLEFTEAPPLCIDPAKTYTAVFTTSAGVVRATLDSQTPVATNNFVVLSRYHYYDATDLFRTSTSIGIIQGGSPHTQDNSDPGPGYTIVDEGFDDEVAVNGGPGPYTYAAGDLVYARPGGQADSSSAQFFFCATDACSGLDSQGIYIKFGTVTEGLDVLASILATAPEGEGAPDPAVTLQSVTIEEA